ncbi:Pkinase-domain-containing protein [Coniophora puteana RWD-64-598 SS2]|uniref:non-specific serine/threonine protein kinase n=1 Tax=Coniophora puteana (strain RWD-64-598) TaxID=741705 RepID=A0A5M3MK17_CONPW|nr:Pkinase-domain-containing protein [Coniophora puteana RWD-64-598 SS2]EIW79280.1 Pkinase-domain-containing protein [Coniophora puteana RWD-64-598 SS2]
MEHEDFPKLPRKREYDDPKMIGLWRIGRTIGQGSSGRVRLARHQKTKQMAAVKIVSKALLVKAAHSIGDTPEHMMLGVEREIVIMKLIHHPNILRLYDVWETTTDLYLILEYVEGGELFDYLCAKGRLSTYEALGYFHQIISAVHYCHRFNVAHRDLKPENLLMDENKNIKVADFGMAAWQPQGLLQTACGSPHYAAPEVVMGKPYNGRSSDVWSCGVILYALLVGKLPFDNEDQNLLLEAVKAVRYEMPKGILNDSARDLISRMLEKDVTKRITIPEILQHPFYLLRPPTAPPADMPPLDEIAKPLSGSEEIDWDVLGNLKTLWNNTPESDILDSLRTDEPNWQKGVYRLLIDYRSRRLEDWDGDEDEELVSPIQKAAPRSERGPSYGMKKTISQASGLGQIPSSLPRRLSPPTPHRVTAPSYLNGSDALHETISWSPSRGSLPPLSPLPPIILPNPDTPLSEYLAPFPHNLNTPLSPNYHTIISPHPNTPISSKSNAPLSPNSVSSPLSTITVPEVQDDKMQVFFQQIVDHLHAMEERTTPINYSPLGFSPLPLGSPLGTDSSIQAFGDNKRLGRHVYSSQGSAASGQHVRTRSRGDKENNGLALLGPGALKWPSLNPNDSARSPLHVRIIEPSPRKLRKKRSLDVSAISPALSDGSFAMTGPRRHWLANVFKFRPTTHQLLSVHDIQVTRNECRRLLVSLGAHVAVTRPDDNNVLKCRFDELKDPARVMSVLKAVRFRVELHDPPAGQLPPDCQVLLHFIQEKGASTSFQSLFNSLRRIWDMDGKKTLLSSTDWIEAED